MKRVTFFSGHILSWAAGSSLAQASHLSSGSSEGLSHFQSSSHISAQPLPLRSWLPFLYSTAVDPKSTLLKNLQHAKLYLSLLPGDPILESRIHWKSLNLSEGSTTVGVFGYGNHLTCPGCGQLSCVRLDPGYQKAKEVTVFSTCILICLPKSTTSTTFPNSENGDYHFQLLKIKVFLVSFLNPISNTMLSICQGILSALPSK